MSVTREWCSKSKITTSGYVFKRTFRFPVKKRDVCIRVLRAYPGRRFPFGWSCVRKTRGFSLLHRLTSFVPYHLCLTLVEAIDHNCVFNLHTQLYSYRMQYDKRNFTLSWASDEVKLNAPDIAVYLNHGVKAGLSIIVIHSVCITDFVVMFCSSRNMIAHRTHDQTRLSYIFPGSEFQS